VIWLSRGEIFGLPLHTFYGKKAPLRSGILCSDSSKNTQSQWKIGGLRLCIIRLPVCRTEDTISKPLHMRTCTWRKLGIVWPAPQLYPNHNGIHPDFVHSWLMSRWLGPIEENKYLLIRPVFSVLTQAYCANCRPHWALHNMCCKMVVFVGDVSDS
jgi:hypothetical protein